MSWLLPTTACRVPKKMVDGSGAAWACPCWLSSAGACFALLISLSAPASAAGWKLVFEDEFDGDALDRSRWATRYIYGNETLDFLNDEAQRYRDKGNHVIKNGVLDLVARKTGDGYESGMIRSRQTFYYGYFEARILLPKGRGVFPAFWLNPDYDINGRVTWPPEIDIFEYAMNGKDDRDTMFHSAASGALRFLYVDPAFNQKYLSYVAERPLNDDWHVFGLLWVPGTYTVYFDGKKIYTREFQWVKSDGASAPPAHVLLNLAVGGKWAGRYGIDDGFFPQALSVDYVRVCQYSRDDQAKATCGTGGYSPDPGKSAYDAPQDDLAKPVVGAAGITVGRTVTAPRSAAIVVGGDTINVEAAVEVMAAMPTNRKTFLGLRHRGMAQPVVSSLSEIYAEAFRARERTSVAASLMVPKTLNPGEYELIMGMAVDPSTFDTPQNAPGPDLTPLVCRTPLDVMNKSTSCVIGRIQLRGP